MRPIILTGHERAITQVKYNREGDLIFTAGKDGRPSVWHSSNGERIGTYDGHKGSVWCHDVDWDTTRFLSGGGDLTIRLWDVATGVELNKVEKESPIRTCLFSFGGKTVAFSTDQAMGQPCQLSITDLRGGAKDVIKVPIEGSKVTSILWGGLDETLITGHDDGKLNIWDLKMNKIVKTSDKHAGSISDLQANRDGTLFISASKDHSARLFETDNLNCLKTYKTDRPVNSACTSPDLKHVCLGGGLDASSAASSRSEGKFETRFFHLVFEEEFARVKGHFGPINSLAYHPSGTQYMSGGEDGLVRIQNFDQSYFDHKSETYVEI